MTGTVKFFLNEKGYGFIASDDGAQDDIFLHKTSCSSKNYTPAKDDRVQFETKQGKKGIEAAKVSKI